LRMKEADEEYKELCIERVWQCEKADYDTLFRLGNRRKTCMELVYEADVERRLGIVPRRSRLTGQQYVEPQQMLNANVDVVWDSTGKIPITVEEPRDG